VTVIGRSFVAPRAAAISASRRGRVDAAVQLPSSSSEGDSAQLPRQ
jgi:hypothetical protein